MSGTGVPKVVRHGQNEYPKRLSILGVRVLLQTPYYSGLTIDFFEDFIIFLQFPSNFLPIIS